MALNKEITDEVGVKTVYHKVHKFEGNGRSLNITVRSFVDDTQRQREKDAADQDALADQRALQVEDLQSEINELMAQNADESKSEEIAAKTSELNELVMDPDAPRYSIAIECHAKEFEIEIPYFEPLTFPAIYEALQNGDSVLAGATEA